MSTVSSVPRVVAAPNGLYAVAANPSGVQQYMYSGPSLQHKSSDYTLIIFIIVIIVVAILLYLYYYYTYVSTSTTTVTAAIPATTAITPAVQPAANTTPTSTTTTPTSTITPPVSATPAISSSDAVCSFITSDADLLSPSNLVSTTFVQMCCTGATCDCGNRQYLQCGKCLADGNYYQTAAAALYNDPVNGYTAMQSASATAKLNFTEQMSNLSSGGTMVQLRPGACSGLSLPGCTCSAAGSDTNYNLQSCYGASTGGGFFNIAPSTTACLTST